MIPAECWPADVEPLPGVAGEIAEVIGRQATLRLIGKLPAAGGRSWRRVLYVPRRMSDDHPLIALVGPLDAERLRQVFGGEILQPPTLAYLERRHRTRTVIELGADGADPADIAEMVGLSIYRVREILRGPRPGAIDRSKDPRGGRPRRDPFAGAQPVRI